MRRALAALLVFLLLIPLVASAAAEPAPTLYIDGQPVLLTQPPVVVGGSVMVPLRPVFEALGAVITWDPVNRAVVASRGSRRITVSVGAGSVQVDGRSITLSRPAEILEGTTMVPLDLFSKALDVEVQWHERSRRIDLTTHVGGAVAFAMSAEPRLLIPLLSAETTASSIIALLFDGLIGFDEKLNPVPALASAYTVQDEKLYTFTLREDVTWHDGQPFTARDVLFTFFAMAHPGYTGPRGSALLPVKGATALQEGYAATQKAVAEGKVSAEEGRKAMLAAWEAWKQTGGIQSPDEWTVVVELEKPYAPFLVHFAGSWIMPAHLWSDWVGEKMAQAPYGRAPVGTGMYRFAAWNPREIILERNPQWRWGPTGQHPRLQQVLFREVNTEWNEALLSGKVDVASINASLLDAFKQVPFLAIHEIPSYSYTYLGYNLKHPILADVRVRKAFTHATNRIGLITEVLGGHGRILNSHSSPHRWDYNPDVPAYDVDQTRANQLLDEAGWKMGPDGWRYKDGKPLAFEIAVHNNYIRMDTALFIKKSLQKVGAQATIRVMEWNNFLDYIDGEQKEAYISGWGLGYDPDPYSIFHSQGGFSSMSSYSNPVVDELIEQGTATTDLTRRKEIYQRLQQVLAEDQPYTWLFAATRYVAYNKRIQGIMPDRIGPSGPEGHLENWYVNP